MLQTISSDICITGTNPFHPKSSGKDGKINSAQVPLNQDLEETGDEKSTRVDENQVQKPRLKLPVLTRTKTVNNVFEDSDDLQVLLRVRCDDFPLQVRGLIPQGNESDANSPTSSDFDVSASQDLNETSERQKSGKDISKDKNNILPLSSLTVLEGQRVNLLGKEGLNKQCKLQKKKTTEGDNLSYQTDMTSQESDIEDVKASNLVPLKSRQQVFQPPRVDKFHITNKDHVTPRSRFTERASKLLYDRDSRSSIVSSTSQHARPTFRLPKVDKYDINTKNIVEVKVCSVFKGSHVKSILIYSGYNDSWIPRHDGRVIKNAVFKAIMQQPAMFLRQPLAEARMKVDSNEHADSLVVASAPSTPIDTEVTPEVKKFVVRLPPIC